MSFGELLSYFFTHKDFLPPPSDLPGTMFTPLHFIVAGIFFASVIILSLWISRMDHDRIKRVFFIIWISVTVVEATKLIWETFSGESVNFWLGGMLPLYPCSIFMYAMPLCIFGKGWVKRAGCGYLCTLGFLGGLINFAYPATIINDYSILSFPGIQTMAYHGALVLCTIVMIKSGYHSFRGVKHFYELLIPAIPALVMSVPANLVNFSSVGSDYMFFRLSSFFLAPIGAALPTGLCVVIAYALYLILHAIPYLPSYISYKINAGKNKV